ncbi:MAG: riboflavin biosynthesis protein RibF [Ruminococcaceae bacterium]|nr:riboflavin biosynthesis protein RibF [Oscillospiraceae bacterium]
MTPRLICLDLRGGTVRPLEAPLPPTVLCLGNFDGVHLAHAALVREGRRLTALIRAQRNDPRILCGVFCFLRPSGDYFLQSGTHPTHLTTLKERIVALQGLGVDVIWLCDFPTVRDMLPSAFLNLLQAECACVGAVCGYNHRFGRKAAGDPSLLAATLGEACISVLPPLSIDGIPVSSTRIRACLSKGDVETAERLLGRPYSLEGRVLHGKSLGHTWGFPTANQIFPADRLIPAHGVYAVTCYTPSGTFPGVANIGLRPTVESPQRVNCETHIIGFSGDLYGKMLKVEFCKFLRPEQRFDSVEELTAAIRRDTHTAAVYGARRQAQKNKRSESS